MPINVQGLASGNVAEVDGQNAVKVQPRPIAVGLLGSYSVTVKSGIMAAGLGAAAPIVAFLWKPAVVPTSLCLIKRIKFGMMNLGIGFTAGNLLFDFFYARAFTVQDTGGAAATLTTNNAKNRTAFATTQAAIQVSATATLTAGTRTLDANPFRTLFGQVTTTTTPFSVTIPDTVVYEAKPGEWPLVFAGTGEGFVIQATVAATGTWTFGCGIDYDEVASTEI